MDRRKKVSEIADASVAYLMKMALDPKKMDAMNRIVGPVEVYELRRIRNHICFAGCGRSAVSRMAAPFNCWLDI
jgi:hypothetical protein